MFDVMAEVKKTKDTREENLPTLDNLSEAVGSMPLDKLDERQRLLIAYAEVKTRMECEAAKVQVEIERVQYKEKYKAKLEELKNILSIVRLADFVKLIPGFCIA